MAGYNRESTGRWNSLYAGGDVPGLALVTTAIGHGGMALERSTHAQNWYPRRPVHQGIESPMNYLCPSTIRHEDGGETPRPAGDRCTRGLDFEPDLGITEEQFQTESQRCMS